MKYSNFKNFIKKNYWFLLNTKKGEIISLAFILSFFTVIYSKILTYCYTGADFFGQIAGNNNLERALTTPLSEEFLGDNWYRPVDTITLYLNYKISGLDPLIYQATNLMIFIIAMLLVYLFSKIVFKNKKMALFSCVILGFYPLNMFIIPNVTFRAEMLIAVFMLLTLIFLYKFLKTGNRKWQILSIISAFLLVLSKEIAFIMMPIIVVIFILFNDQNKKLTYKNLICKMTPYLFTIILYFSLIAIFLGEYYARGLKAGEEGLIYLLSDRLIALVIFFKSIAYPIDVFGLEYTEVFSFSGFNVTGGYILSAVVGLVLISWFVLYIYKKKIQIKKIFSLGYLNRKFNNYDFLILWIVFYLSFFLFYGRYAIYYSYFTIAPISILISYILIKKNKSFKKDYKKWILAVFLVFSVIIAPMFTSYSNYEVSSETKKDIVSSVIDAFESIPNNATVYVIPSFGGVKGTGYSAGIPPYSLKALLYLKYPDNSWNLFPVSQFVVDNANQGFLSNYSTYTDGNDLIITLNGENILFYKYGKELHTLPIRENVTISGGFFPYNGSGKQTVVIKDFNSFDYILFTTIQKGIAKVELIQIKDV